MVAPNSHLTCIILVINNKRISGSNPFRWSSMSFFVCLRWLKTGFLAWHTVSLNSHKSFYHLQYGIYRNGYKIQSSLCEYGSTADGTERHFYVLLLHITRSQVKPSDTENFLAFGFCQTTLYVSWLKTQKYTINIRKSTTNSLAKHFRVYG